MEDEEKSAASPQFRGLLKESRPQNGSVRSVNKLYASGLLVASGTTLDKIGLGSTRSLDKTTTDEYLPWTSTKYKVLRTIFVVLSHVSMGMFMEIVGPTMPDIKYRVGVNYEEVSRALLVRSIGYLFGALLNGALTDLLPRHVELVAAVGFAITTLGIALTPWCRLLWFLCVCFFMQGYGQGAMDICNNLLVLRIWGRKAASPMFLLHIGYGLGALIANQLARPFIKTFPESIESNGTLSNASIWNTSISENATAIPEIWNPIEIPYLLIAAYTFIFAIQFLVFYIIESLQKKKDKTKFKALPTGDGEVKEKTNPFKKCSAARDESEKLTFLVAFFGCMFVYFFTTMGVEQSFSKFLYSFAIESNSGFTRAEASNLHSLFWLCFMGGRALMIPVSLFVRPDIYTMAYVIADVICTLVLSLAGSKNIMVLWVFSALFGVVHGPLAPNAFGWSNLYVMMTGARVAVVTVACALGQMGYQWVTGYLFEYHGAESIMYINLVHAGLLLTSFIGAFVVARRTGQRFTTVQSEATGNQENATVHSSAEIKG